MGYWDFSVPLYCVCCVFVWYIFRGTPLIRTGNGQVVSGEHGCSDIKKVKIKVGYKHFYLYPNILSFCSYYL
nr:MAG TPA: glycoprotein [Caudoviricetes sp.]